MNKVVLLTSLLTFLCSIDDCSAKGARQLAQAPQSAESTPELRGTLPVTPAPSPVAPSVNSNTSTAATPTIDSANTSPDATTVASPIITDPSSTTPTTTTTTSSTTINQEIGREIKKFDDTMPTLRTDLPAGALQGTANITDIEVSARTLKKCPLQRDHDKGLKYVQVTVKNSGQNIAVILGNSAHLDVAGGNLPTAPASDAVESDIPRLNGKGKLAVGVVAAFSFGYAAPIVYENLTPDQHRKRSLGESIGRDGARHEVESGHFGVRVIMPGDETTGWIAFRCPRDQAVRNVIIPVSYTRSAVPSGAVTVPVGQSLTN